MNFDELEQVTFHHPIYDADQRDSNPFWYRESLNTGYQFRLAPRDPDKPQPSCRIDQDESGDYDPTAKHPVRVIPEKRKRETVLQVGENGESIPRKPRPRLGSWQIGRFNGLSLPVTLNMTSERGRVYLELLGKGSDNWPVDDQSSSSSSQDLIFWSESSASSKSSPRFYEEQPYKFRRRERADQPEDDDLDLSKLNLGHPAARGCIPCLKLRLTCTLLQDGATYPCQDCVEDNCDCELVLEPLVKLSCQGCRRRRLKCSYLEPGSDHSRACRTCSNISVKCIAGPASGRTRTGPSLDQLIKSTPSTLPPGTTGSRLFVSCTQCRQAKKWCSLRSLQQAGPCNRCNAGGTSCTFEPLRRTLKPQSITTTPTQTQHDFTLPSKCQPACSSAQPAETKEITITTRLPHPIRFNHEPSDCCSWCLDPLHGLMGFRTVRPLVRDTLSGYIEISGGHTSQGYLPSKMCVCCTLDRFRILGCEGHEMKLLEGVDPEGFDDERIMEALLPGMAGDVEWEWCSVCPNPAMYGCGRPSDGIDGEEAEVGCGLRLCEYCAVVLASECQGDLEALIVMKMTEAEGEGEDGNDLAVRADADLLLRNGELLRRIGVVEEEG